VKSASSKKIAAGKSGRERAQKASGWSKNMKDGEETREEIAEMKKIRDWMSLPE